MATGSRSTCDPPLVTSGPHSASAGEGKLSVLYWEDGKVAWVLLGELPREQLLDLAHQVYAALQS